MNSVSSGADFPADATQNPETISPPEAAEDENTTLHSVDQSENADVEIETDIEIIGDTTSNPRRKPRSAKTSETEDEPSEKLHKLMARAGIASRRAAEEIIREGRVSINGHLQSEPGARVVMGRDHVLVDGKPLRLPTGPGTVLLLHKPRGVMTTRSDPEGRETVMDLVGRKWETLHPVGRLDFETSGVLLLTDDGDLTQLLTHPSHGVEKTYQARVRGEVKLETVRHLQNGVRLEDGVTAPCRVRVRAQTESNALVEITLREGRNRQVRRMLEAVGHQISTLRRVKFGPLEMAGLPSGAFRILLPGEIHALRKAANTKSKPLKPPARPTPKHSTGAKKATPRSKSALPSRPEIARETLPPASASTYAPQNRTSASERPSRASGAPRSSDSRRPARSDAAPRASSQTTSPAQSTPQPYVSSRPTSPRPTSSRPTSSPRPTSARPTSARPTSARPTSSPRPISPRPVSSDEASRPVSSRSSTSRPTSARPTSSRSSTSRPTSSRPTSSRSPISFVPREARAPERPRADSKSSGTTFTGKLKKGQIAKQERKKAYVPKAQNPEFEPLKGQGAKTSPAKPQRAKTDKPKTQRGATTRSPERSTPQSGLAKRIEKRWT